MNLRALILFAAAATAVAAHADLSFANFGTTSGLTLNGDAHAVDGALRLTDVADYQAGSVWANARQSVLGGFDTSFTYHIGEGDGADGLVFAIQGIGPTALGANGGGLGFNDLYKSFGVELRTYIYDRIDYNFYTYNPGMPSAPNANLRGDHAVRVTYDGNLLNTYLDGTLALSSAIDLASYLPDSADGKYSVGFTSGTGGSNDVHEIGSWSFKEGAVQAVPAPGALASFGAGALGALRRRRKAASRTAPSQTA